MSTTARRAAGWTICAGLPGVGAGLLLRAYPLPIPHRQLISLGPVVPLLVYCGLILRLIRELDELQPRIQLEGAVYGLPGTALPTMRARRLVRGVGLPPVNLAQAWPSLWISAFLPGTAEAGVARRRYQ